MIVGRDFISGIPLFVAAVLIAPPPVGISGMLKEYFNIDLSMGKRIAITILMLFIAWLALP